MSEAVVVKHATKKFGNPESPLWKRMPRFSPALPAAHLQTVTAVEDVSFTIEQGEIFGILGPSGSGKSTLIRLLATLLLPDAGDLRIFGYDVVSQPGQVQRLINRVSVEASFFKKLSPVENLIYSARLYGLSGHEVRRRIIEVLSSLGLEMQVISQPMEAMSRSMQQKVSIARALLPRPRLLLLDDPTARLDPQSRQSVHQALRELRDQHGATILITTRDPQEAACLCDQVARLQSGRILSVESQPQSIPESFSGDLMLPLNDSFLGLPSQRCICQEAMPH